MSRSSWMKDLPKALHTLFYLMQYCICSTCVHVPLEPATWNMRLYTRTEYLEYWYLHIFGTICISCMILAIAVSQMLYCHSIWFLAADILSGRTQYFTTTSHSNLKSPCSSWQYTSRESSWIYIISTVHMFTEWSAYDIRLPRNFDDFWFT